MLQLQRLDLALEASRLRALGQLVQDLEGELLAVLLGEKSVGEAPIAQQPTQPVACDPLKWARRPGDLVIRWPSPVHRKKVASEPGRL